MYHSDFLSYSPQANRPVDWRRVIGLSICFAMFSPFPSASEINLQPQLHLARDIRLRRDHAEIRIAEALVRPGELWRVEEVEKFAAKLHALALRDREGFEERKVEIPDPVGAHVRDHAWRGAERKRRGLTEDGGVEPTSELLIRRAVA